MEGWCTEALERLATGWLKVNGREMRTSAGLCWLGCTAAHEGCSLLEQHWRSPLPLFFIHVFLVSNKNMDFSLGRRE